jgi:DNA-binding CsgD family transcriptional regulator
VRCAEASQGRARQFWPVFDESAVPMVLLDNERRYLSANRAARLLLRLSLAELRQCRMDDLVSPDKLDLMRSVWDRFIRTGSVAGNDVVAFEAGSPVRISYSVLANVLPGQHLMVFMPAEWPEDELGAVGPVVSTPASVSLSRREREVLTLIAAGADSQEIASDLTISPATVKTHVENAHRKLGARNRAHAIALAIQLGVL